jgi:hypothetical protein
MINKHENISVGVHWGDVGVLAESCQGDRTQGQQAFLKMRKVQPKCTRCGTIST